MSKRLKDIIERFLTTKGPAGKAVLAAAAGKHPATIDRWIKNGCPTAHDAYKLALACGCTEKDALYLSKEFAPQVSEETA